MVFLIPSQQMLEYYLFNGHNCFLLYALPFITHLSPYQMMLVVFDTESTVDQTINNFTIQPKKNEDIDMNLRNHYTRTLS
jgi:hypothetical protein